MCMVPLVRVTSKLLLIRVTLTLISFLGTKRNRNIQSNLKIPDYFDFSCDICPAQKHLEGNSFTTLEETKAHYLQEHSNEMGYIKCCFLKFYKQREIKEHIQWHETPDQFRFYKWKKSVVKASSAQWSIFQFQMSQMQQEVYENVWTKEAHSTSAWIYDCM